MTEQDQEEQAYQQHQQFMDWFNSNTIRGDFFKACNELKDKIPQIISMETLEDAFYWQPRAEGDVIDDMELPF